MAIFKKPAIKIQGRKKRDIPQGLFQKCPGCDEVIHELELIENQRVCPHCDYHFPQTAKERIESELGFSAEVRYFAEFIRSSKRGIIR